MHDSNLRQVLAISLSDIKNAGSAEACDAGRLLFVVVGILRLASHNGGENQDAFLAFLDEAAELVPSAKARDLTGIRFLHRDEQDVVQTECEFPDYVNWRIKRWWRACFAGQGQNHEILDEFQKLGYPIFSQNTSIDEDLLERLFGDEVRGGVISSPLDITDASKNSYSCSTNHKVWAAKFTARHPNLVALEISSFKCGHDAPIYGVVEGIIEQSGTPYFCFKDLDENKPSGSIRIRVETIDYFLRRYREEVIRKRKAEQEINAQLAALEADLMRERREGGTHSGIEGKSWEPETQAIPAD